MKRIKLYSFRAIALILALQMALVSGIFAFAGGGSETEIIVPDEQKVEISALNLILDGEIGLIYHIFVPSSYKNGTFKLECGKHEPIILNIKECARDDDGRYLAKYELSAIELSDKVKISVLSKSGVLIEQAEYSAEEYANQLLLEGKATAAEEAVIKTLMNYGHYAQIACADENAWIIGNEHQETKAFYEPTAADTVFDKYGIKTSDDDYFDKIGLSLHLDYKTGITLYFPAEEKPEIKINDIPAEAEESKKLAGYYQIRIDGINALHLEDEYTVAVNDQKITLCAFSYCKLAMKKAESKTISAIKALYEFYEATYKYSIAKGK